MDVQADPCICLSHTMKQVDTAGLLVMFQLGISTSLSETWEMAKRVNFGKISYDTKYSNIVECALSMANMVKLA